MNCPKCHSENVNIQVVTEHKLKTKHHSILYWLIVGWWWEPILWLFLTLPKLIVTIFGIGKKQKLVVKEKKVAVCQQCGHTWNI